MEAAAKDDDYELTEYEKTKRVLLLPLSLARLALVFVLIHLTYLYSIVGNETGIRRWFPLMSRFTLFLVGFYRVPVRGQHNLLEGQDANAIAVYNHVSVFDFLVLYGYVYPFSMVMNAGHGSTYLFRHVARKMKFVLVTTSPSARVDVAGGVDGPPRLGHGQTAKLLAHSGNMLAIAPEGKTTNGKALLPFRRGAFVPLRPILPILLKYRYRHANIAWTHTSVVSTIWRALGQFANHVSVELLPVVHPEPDETPGHFCERVRVIMATGLGVKMVST